MVPIFSSISCFSLLSLMHVNPPICESITASAPRGPIASFPGFLHQEPCISLYGLYDSLMEAWCLLGFQPKTIPLSSGEWARTISLCGACCYCWLSKKIGRRKTDLLQTANGDQELIVLLVSTPRGCRHMLQWPTELESLISLITPVVIFILENHLF